MTMRSLNKKINHLNWVERKWRFIIRHFDKQNLKLKMNCLSSKNFNIEKKKLYKQGELIIADLKEKSLSPTHEEKEDEFDQEESKFD